MEDVELTVRVDRGRLAADGVEVEDLVFWQHDGEEWSQVEHSVAQSGEEWLVAVVDADDLSTVAAGYRDAGASEGQTPGSTGAEASVIRTTAASVDRDVATTGDPVLVTATVEAAEQSEHVAELTVDGEPVATERVSVDASGTATVTFEHAFEEADTFDVAVDGVEAGTVTVESGATTVSESGDAQSGLAIGEALAALALVGVGVGVRSWNRRER